MEGADEDEEDKEHPKDSPKDKDKGKDRAKDEPKEKGKDKGQHKDKDKDEAETTRGSQSSQSQSQQSEQSQRAVDVRGMADEVVQRCKDSVTQQVNVTLRDCVPSAVPKAMSCLALSLRSTPGHRHSAAVKAIY